MDLVNVYDYKQAAGSRLDKMIFDYYAGGANDEITLHDNHAAYDDIKLQYRVLQGVEGCDMRTTLFGQPLSMPLMVAPMGFQSMAHSEGELATRRACASAETLMILSTASNFALEDVAAAAPESPFWFQLYLMKDEGLNREIVERAKAAGCKAFVLTVDTPTLGHRERDARNRFQLPDGLTIKNLEKTVNDRFPEAEGSGLMAFTQAMFKLSLSWDDVAWLAEATDLPVLIKGVAHPEDARIACDNGVDGIFVSNHGGRQLDTAPATIATLPGIVAAVDGRMPVLIDGGIRRGTDIVKALALGADAVAIGRPVLWGLSVNGQAGVEHVLQMVRSEFETAMMLCGCQSLADISAELIF